MAAILKCWQDRGLYQGHLNFDPVEFLQKLVPANYEWRTLKGQVAQHAWIEPTELLSKVRQRFSFMSELTPKEIELCQDRWQKRPDLHDEVWGGLRTAAAERY